MENIVVDVSFPYSDSAQVCKVAVEHNCTAGELYSRSIMLFKDVDLNLKYDLLIQSLDDTYIYADPDNTLSVYNISNKPKACIVPKKHKIRFQNKNAGHFGISGHSQLSFEHSESTFDQFKDLEVSLDIPVSELKEQIKSHFLRGNVDVNDFVICTHRPVDLRSEISEIDDKESSLTMERSIQKECKYMILFESLSLAEQAPGETCFLVIDKGDKGTKIEFIDIYVKGPVYIPISDAYRVSAYLLQAVLGPSRCYKGLINSLTDYLPRRFRGIKGAAAELMKEWRNLENTTRLQAEKLFANHVQYLPYFNCTSFSGEAIKGYNGEDKMPHKFEIVLTSCRVIFLDYMKFKIFRTIDFNQITHINVGDPEASREKVRANGTIELIYGEDSWIKFSTNTPKSFYDQLLNLMNCTDEGNSNRGKSHSFGKPRLDSLMPHEFHNKYIKEFVNLDESENVSENVSHSDLVHALSIRAESCAWHISVLLSRVKPDYTGMRLEKKKNDNEIEAKHYRVEILHYYKRLMCYLRYLSFDHRPYDIAYRFYQYIIDLHGDEAISDAIKCMDEVLSKLKSVRNSFQPISTDPFYVNSKIFIAYLLSHYISFLELPYATKITDENGKEPFIELQRNYFRVTKDLRDSISAYMFNLGDRGLKEDIQRKIDGVFSHHLSSLVYFPLIVESSDFGHLDPTLMLHQDSCNCVMSSMAEFSRVLWEDRVSLGEEELKEFLTVAENLTREFLEITDDRLFDKMVKLNKFLTVEVRPKLPFLKTPEKNIFSMVVAAASQLEADVNRMGWKGYSLDMPVIGYDFLKLCAILTLANPLKLAQEETFLLKSLSSSLTGVCESYIKEFEFFELTPEEAASYDLCALVQSIKRLNEEIKSDKKLGEKPANELYKLLIQPIALQNLLSRPVCDSLDIFIRIYNTYTWYTHALATVIISCFRSDDTLTGSFKDDTCEAMNLIGENDECIYLIPDYEVNSNYVDILRRIMVDIESVVRETEFEPLLTLLSTLTEIGFEPIMLDGLSSTCNVRLLIESSIYSFTLCMNELQNAVTVDISSTILAYAHVFNFSKVVCDALKSISTCNGFFEAPSYWTEANSHANSLERLARFTFTDYVIPPQSKSQLISYSTFVHSLSRITADVSLEDLSPLIRFDLKTLSLEDIVPYTYRRDMGEALANYRVAKSDFLRCATLPENSSDTRLDQISFSGADHRDKDSTEKSHGVLISSIEEIIRIACFYIDVKDENIVKLIKHVNEFSSYLPAIWTYNLPPIHVKSKIEPLDRYVDRVLDMVSEKMFATIDIQTVKGFIKRCVDTIYEPKDRDVFAKEFIKKLGNLEKCKDLDVMYELIMLINDNNLSLFVDTAETVPEFDSIAMDVRANNYASMVIDAERLYDNVMFAEFPVWYKNIIKNLVDEIKSSPYSKSSKDVINILLDGINGDGSDLEYSLERIRRCVQSLNDFVSNYKALGVLGNTISSATSNFERITNRFNFFKKVVHENPEFSNGYLDYKDCMLLVVKLFYKEFVSQNWDPDLFSEVCTLAEKPLSSSAKSNVLSAQILAVRKLLRSLCSFNSTVSPHFVKDAEIGLNKLHTKLRDLYSTSNEDSKRRVAKQKEAVASYITRFGMSKSQTQFQKFVVRLLENLSHSITTFNTCETDKLSSSIFTLAKALDESKKREDQLAALISWLKEVERGVLPLDREDFIKDLELLQIRIQNYHDIESTDMAKFDIVDRAEDLSMSLADLTRLRNKLNILRSARNAADGELILKNMKVYAIREPLLRYVNTLLRALEAYAEEIHLNFKLDEKQLVKSTDDNEESCYSTVLFRPDSEESKIERGELAKVTEKTSKMCGTIHKLIEAAFEENADVSHIAKECEDSFIEFINNCPKNLAETCNAESAGSLEVLRYLQR